MKSTPFRRAIAMMHAIQAALSSGVPLAAVANTVGEYKSRGKGLGRYSGRKLGPMPSGKYTGVTNGKRECARRMRQIQRGIIAASA